MNTHGPARDGYFVSVKSKDIHAIEDDASCLTTKKAGYFTRFIRRNFPINVHQRIDHKIIITEYRFLINKSHGRIIAVRDVVFSFIIIPGKFSPLILVIVEINRFITIKSEMIIAGRELGYFVLKHFNPNTIAKCFMIVSFHLEFDHTTADELLCTDSTKRTDH